MINLELFNPKSIVVVGGSENKFKPGGKVLENIIKGNFKGNLYVVNPKSDMVQGIKSYKNTEDLPSVDLAILAIPAKFCYDTVSSLANKKTKAFVILSAGFGELDVEGKNIEAKLIDFAQKNKISILGPNCIGLINENYKGVFTTPVPKFNPQGVQFISSSGSTAVFVMEAGIKMGMQFSEIYSVGNAIQIRVEDLLKHIDENYIPGKSSPILMMYIEQLSNPKMILKHSQSLIKKGCSILALKSGITDAGSRAAASHTGAMASPQIVVETLFKKAGIIQCYSREELLYNAGVLYYGQPRGANVAVVTHAGGAGVICADTLEKNGMKVPELTGEKPKKLLSKLDRGSSVSNPIDFLATGTSEQLGIILDYCNNELKQIDQTVVIFGSPGLFDVSGVYDLLSNKINNTKKPIYPVLPSPVNTADAIQKFIDNDKIFFPDEAILAKSISKIYNSPKIYEEQECKKLKIPENIKKIIEVSKNSFLKPEEIREFLNLAGIKSIKEWIVKSILEIDKLKNELTFPIVMKAIGPIHKTDIGGVILDIFSYDQAVYAFEKLMSIEQCSAVLIQPMIKGIELYVGSKKEKDLGHIIMTGMGGIYLESIKDISSSLVPVGYKEAENMIKSLQSYTILNGIRGKKGINIYDLKNIIVNLSCLLNSIPEISELDINPLIATGNSIYAVDCRIKLE